MKRATMITIVMMAASVTLFAQTDKQIAAIRAEVNLINKNAPKYQKRTKDIDGLSLEGTRATFFTSGKGLKKITAKIYGETFRATTELFYSGEEMIFAFQRLERYDTHVAADPPPKVASIVETRVYFANAAAIRVLRGTKRLLKSDVLFEEAEMEMRELSDMLKAAFNK